ncbi:energy transducer TonB [Pseudoxanthomonas sp. PXM01]|uniref:energy transducer TonB n=1 Tax=Pseudoxanthomonas sp. PXM01 TaxID=2769295 RepID=UPI001781B90A|nr:energy transducer TonB [Pseudoxanthomonas sp. PXM01]MBD9468480.1 energy transducer TonB [Pseudoxanthomonas sp. PXM01]
MVRALPHGSDTRIDIGRIAAIAAAIAVHAAALLMLLMPMAAPPLAAPAKPKEDVRWYPKEKVEPKKPVDAEIVKRVEPKPVEPRPAVQPRIETPPVIDVPIIDNTGSERVIDLPAIDSGEIGGTSGQGITGPLSSATLEYVRATSPRYPINELRNGIQGTVILRVLVDIDGKPVDVTIETSSGNRNLDKEARQHVLKTWRFKPAMQNGQAVQAYGLVPIAFNLQ